MRRRSADSLSRTTVGSSCRYAARTKRWPVIAHGFSTRRRGWKGSGLRWSFLLALPAALAAGGACARQSAPVPAQGTEWVATWGASPQLTEPRNLPPAPGLAGSTLRQIVHLSLGGRGL